MFHSGTQLLIDRWTALPDARRIPARADFQPLAFGPMTPQLFMVERQGARIRLAGGWVEKLHGRTLGGADWLSVWREESRPMVGKAMVQAFREARPVVVAADSVRLEGMIEIIIAPLRNRAGVADRMVGLYQAVSTPDRYAEDVGPLTARLSIGVGAIGRAPLSLAAVDGRRTA